jgi:hypothetical protein
MELEMDMELSGSSGNRQFDGLLGFMDVDDGRREQKPQQGSLDIQPTDGGKQQQNNQQEAVPLAHGSSDTTDGSVRTVSPSASLNHVHMNCSDTSCIAGCSWSACILTTSSG